eukprot:CAMPEP_0114556978 /NCGR_PEP_ID=MMETSP0114-20121206/9576_1 /TAXON_ID=31324 /ORGANISM="Goniomonas sp, Strain m" /LENGTH=127 /DNA_ID=CAMNT_0001742217 /DNA_START=11 /DNA_END=394 /DNA_ORIENTATION=+
MRARAVIFALVLVSIVQASDYEDGEYIELQQQPVYQPAPVYQQPPVVYQPAPSFQQPQIVQPVAQKPAYPQDSSELDASGHANLEKQLKFFSNVPAPLFILSFVGGVGIILGLFFGGLYFWEQAQAA